MGRDGQRRQRKKEREKERKKEGKYEADVTEARADVTVSQSSKWYQRSGLTHRPDYNL